MTGVIQKSPHLDRGKVLELLSAQGALSNKLKHFEVRAEQKQMLAHLIEAFNKNAIALIEAGTGTSKSIAYLIPALLAATIWNERVVISTHTIALQEQLLEKDLPLLMEALGIEIKAALVKGMGNYICLRKWDEIEFDKWHLGQEDQETLAHMENLSCHQGVGSKGDFPFTPPSALWEMVSADYETCNGPDCPYYQKCYYVQSRKQALDAQVLIVNHHLLLADLVARGDAQNIKNALLPPYNRLIIDEAHHLEEVATDYFANKTSRLELLKILSKISYEKLGKDQGKLSLIKEKLLKHNPEDFSRSVSELFNRLTIDIPALKREVIKEIADTFHLLDQFQKNEGRGHEENKMRLCAHHYDSTHWSEIIAKKILELTHLLQRFALEVIRIEECIKEFKDERFIEATKGPLHDLKNLAKRLEFEALCLEKFAVKAPSSDTIRWLEATLTKSGLNVSCIDAAINISDLLLKYLFNPFDTVALLSATLTTQGSFAYMKEQMGLSAHRLNGRALIEASYESPFDFEKQALLIIPKDIPIPSSPEFLAHADKIIWDAIDASHGNAFILFTSYGMLQKCYERLHEKLKQNRFYPLKQGSESRGALLSRFIKQDRSVLFGTDSFWEGVDVAGEALRLVIIAKLPFKVPTDPLIQAKSEFITAKGNDPFKELLLPQAAIKFKQGFGRLIRNKKDRGCIICLDNRLITKSYGQYLLKSLPKCPLLVLEAEAIKQTMVDFYKKTYYLTK